MKYIIDFLSFSLILLKLWTLY